MSLEIFTEGFSIDGKGRWSYSIKHRDTRSNVEDIHSDHGEESGTTDIQMSLMAILKALSYVRSMESV
ncbi:MAG: hypothetical protein ACFFDV_10460, partial [Candidatus Thorarchaeota archaeon]